MFTDCQKIYFKYVLHLLKYTANLYVSRCSTDMQYILGHSVLNDAVQVNSSNPDAVDSARDNSVSIHLPVRVRTDLNVRG